MKQVVLDDEEMAMAERLRKLREHLKVSQKVVAEGSKTLQGHLSGMELGSRNIQLRVLTFYAEKYRVNTGWVLTGKGEMFLNEKPTDSEKKETAAAPVLAGGGLLKIDVTGLLEKLADYDARLAAMEEAVGELRARLGDKKED